MSENLNKLSIWEEERSGNRRVCMLMITHACNLRCSYCYESHKQNEYMDVSLAKSIIIREAEMVAHSDKFDELQIDFMGGEPLLNFDLIREIVEWLESDAIPVPWICFATTNAPLLTDERKDWFSKHSTSITLGASYDGTGSMQSINRGTDKFVIDLDFFHQLWPEQSFQMTISKETLPNLADGVLSVQRKGYELNAALAQGVDWTIEDALVYREQLTILKNQYLSDLSLKPLNRLIRYMDVFDVNRVDKKQIHGCGSGHNMITYDPSGRTYGCHMFSPIVLGNKSIGIADIDWDKPDLMVDEFCNNCVLRIFCPTCPGFNMRYRGSLSSRDKRWCPMVLAEALTACEFQIERIAMLENLTKEDAEHAKMALNAYAYLKDFDIASDTSPYNKISPEK